MLASHSSALQKTYFFHTTDSFGRQQKTYECEWSYRTVQNVLIFFLRMENTHCIYEVRTFRLRFLNITSTLFSSAVAAYPKPLPLKFHIFL